VASRAGEAELATRLNWEKSVTQESRRGRRPRSEAARNITKFRSDIDRIDRQVLRLLNRRARLAQRIGQSKQQENAATFVPGREQRLLRDLIGANEGPLPDRAVVGIYREIISASRALEAPIEVAYLGPEATFTEAAARRHFGTMAHYVPVESIPEVFSAVESGRVRVGVVPVENSTEGVVAHTLDMFVHSPLKICAELELVVQHCLMGKRTGTKWIRRIVSHPQSLAQCRGWLAAHCPGIPIEPVSSNARAAQIARAEPGVAAIAGEMAAERYGLHLLARAIHDDASNVTRFLVLGSEDTPVPSGSDKTSILMTVRDEVGILNRMLLPFATHGINLCGIESRPLRGKPWEYVFFLDLRRHRQEKPVVKALADLEHHCRTLKILGSYPAAIQGTA
jgi:chorismate mutase/prephenate dehydratase